MMSDSFTCPYCSSVMSITAATHNNYSSSFNSLKGISYNSSTFDDDAIRLHFYRCPKCKEISIQLIGIGKVTKDIFMSIKPKSLAKQFPDYIPIAVRQDYEESYTIVNLSPKASATLSRRCLQNMIRDFWGIKKNRLVDEIAELENKVPPTQWKVIDSMRKIGNIGAHPEADINLIVDIEPANAVKLLKIIEVLIQQWYIEKHELESLYSDVIQINDDTQSQRKVKE